MLLTRHPEGLSGDELLCALYEDESVTPVTLRAELARLRRVLGPGLLASRSYRLTVQVESDVAVVERRLETGAVAAAVTAYTGPLLPGSQAPAVVRLRRLLADGLRTALVTRRNPDLLADWACAPWGEDDLDVWQALAVVRPTAAVRSRPAALESEPDAPPGWCGLKPEMVATDNASYSDSVFGIFRILGYNFSPRFKDLTTNGSEARPFPA